jgi:hypothetical protein
VGRCSATKRIARFRHSRRRLAIVRGAAEITRSTEHEKKAQSGFCLSPLLLCEASRALPSSRCLPLPGALLLAARDFPCFFLVSNASSFYCLRQHSTLAGWASPHVISDLRSPCLFQDRAAESPQEFDYKPAASTLGLALGLVKEVSRNRCARANMFTFSRTPTKLLAFFSARTINFHQCLHGPLWLSARSRDTVCYIIQFRCLSVKKRNCVGKIFGLCSQSSWNRPPFPGANKNHNDNRRPRGIDRNSPVGSLWCPLKYSVRP